MPVKYLRNRIRCCVRSPDFRSLCRHIPHSRTHSFSDDTQFEFRKYSRHMNKRICHGVNLTARTINRNTADNNEPEFLFNVLMILRKPIVIYGFCCSLPASFATQNPPPSSEGGNCYTNTFIMLWGFFCSPFSFFLKIRFN